MIESIKRLKAYHEAIEIRHIQDRKAQRQQEIRQIDIRLEAERIRIERNKELNQNGQNIDKLA